MSIWIWLSVCASINRKRPTGAVIASATGCSRFPGIDLRSRLQGHPVRLPRVLAPLRQILPGPVRRFRDRDRVRGLCAGIVAAGRRGRDALLRAPGRLLLQAQYLAGRVAHLQHDAEAQSVGAAAALLFSDRHRPRAAVDRFRIARGDHLPRNRPGPAPADRRALHGADDHGAAFGFVGARARHRDARPAGSEDARLPVPTAARADLKLPPEPGAIVWTAALQGDIPPTR